MPAATGLSDDQVAGELTKMVEFIKKEAEEKAKEIRVKANEEYEIEKAAVVRAESTAVDQEYEQRYKQSKLDQQVAKSTASNKARFTVLAAKEEVLESVFSDAKEQLAKVASDKGKYEKLLAGLVEEGFHVIKDSKAVVRVREADKELASKAVDAAKKGFKDRTGNDIEASIDSKFLDKDLSGGAVVTDAAGRIWVDNTLDERLKLVYEGALPRIRFELFGPSKSRTFFD